jgi:hypothetical protein
MDCKTQDDLMRELWKDKTFRMWYVLKFPLYALYYILYKAQKFIEMWL